GRGGPVDLGDVLRGERAVVDGVLGHAHDRVAHPAGRGHLPRGDADLAGVQVQPRPGQPVGEVARFVQGLPARELPGAAGGEQLEAERTGVEQVARAVRGVHHEAGCRRTHVTSITGINGRGHTGAPARERRRRWPWNGSSWWTVPSRSQDRKSTRLNSSHVKISYAVFCLK